MPTVDYKAQITACVERLYARSEQERQRRADKIDRAIRCPRSRCPVCNPVIWAPTALPWCQACGHPLLREEVRV